MSVKHSTLVTTALHRPFHYEQDSDPGAVGANKWWADTANQIIYRRNAANSAWVEYSGAGGEGVFLIDGANARITDESDADITLTNAAGDSSIETPHSLLTSGLHAPWNWNQESDPVTTNPDDVMAFHWWFIPSVMGLKLRNTGNTAWEVWK